MVDDHTGKVLTLRRHDVVDGWTLMAIVPELDGRRVVVFESLGTPGGAIVFMSAAGALLKLDKTLVPTRVTEAGCYLGHTKEQALRSGHDLLREEILGQPGDPTHEMVAACFPPIRSVRYGTAEGPHTFVGSRDCADVVPVYYNPLLGATRVNPMVVAPEIRESVERETLWEGLVGGWLPAVRIAYQVGDDEWWDSLMFGAVDPPTPNIQPVWYRYLRLEGGRLAQAHYYDSYLPYPRTIEPDPALFYSALYRLSQYWTRALDGAMQVDLPEGWISDFCRHSMVQEMITRIGDEPRYGILDRNYGGPEHSGFQDILNSSVACCLEWGLFDVAKRYIDNYFVNFVRSDGSIDYRGPEIGQYARMLTGLAQFCEYTGTDEMLLVYEDKVRAIVDILMTRRQDAKRRSPDDPAYGMLSGRHEADISFITPSLGTLDYEQPYFSNSAEAWRAFRDLGRCWISIGSVRGRPDLVERGALLIDEAAALRDDIHRAIGRSWLVRSGRPMLPLIAGSKLLHSDAEYRSRPEAFDENRVWSEMMHSGVIDKGTVEAIIDNAAENGDTCLGIFTNRKLVVAFTVYGEAYGLIQHDLVREFLLFYYAHATHLHTRGTWSVLECVDMDRDRAEHLPYCAPAQMTIPTVTKWMLVYEDPLDDTIWLAKATPRQWLASGNRIAVREAPTRWGRLSYEIRSRLDDGEVEATIVLPPSLRKPAKLRLRVPDQHSMDSVRINGLPWEAFDRTGEWIDLPGDVRSPINLTVHFR